MAAERASQIIIASAGSAAGGIMHSCAAPPAVRASAASLQNNARSQTLRLLPAAPGHAAWNNALFPSSWHSRHGKPTTWV